MCSALLQWNNSVLKMSVFQTVITFTTRSWDLNMLPPKEEKSKRQNHEMISISTKFRKIMLEDRVSVLQELLLNIATSKDKDAWWKIPSYDVYALGNSWRRSWVGHTTQKCFCTRYSFLIYELKVVIFRRRNIFSETFGLTTNHIFR